MPDDKPRAAHEDRDGQVVRAPAHEFQTPIVDRYDASVVTDHMDAPGDEDDGCFSGFPGDVV